MYEDIRTELDAGGRVYIVCPFVEQSKSEGLQGVRAAEEEFARLVVPSIPAFSIRRRPKIVFIRHLRASLSECDAFFASAGHDFFNVSQKR